MSLAPAWPDSFEREYGCTESEWRRCLPGAAGPHALSLPSPGRAVVTLVEDRGRVLLDWRLLPERRIALLSLPRLHVRFRFEGVAAELRCSFMRHFDLFMQRGGG